MFETNLNVRFVDEGPERCLWVLTQPLIYEGNGFKIVVPAGFYTDFASVPRSPLTFEFFGKFNEEAVIHDYLYRIDSDPEVSKETADLHLLYMLQECGRYDEAFCGIVHEAVKFGGGSSFHKRNVMDVLKITDEVTT